MLNLIIEAKFGLGIPISYNSHVQCGQGRGRSNFRVNTEAEILYPCNPRVRIAWEGGLRIRNCHLARSQWAEIVFIPSLSALRGGLFISWGRNARSRRAYEHIDNIECFKFSIEKMLRIILLVSWKLSCALYIDSYFDCLRTIIIDIHIF